MYVRTKEKTDIFSYIGLFRTFFKGGGILP